MTEQLKGTRRGKQPDSTPFPDASEWERVGQTLRTIRELRGFGPAEFAQEIGISRGHLVAIELGRRKLTNVNLARAAQVLRVEQKAIMLPHLAEVAS